MNDILTAMVAITPVTIALVEGAKRTGVPARFSVVVALSLGVAASFLFPPAMAAQNEIAAGVLSGLAASGLYSGAKAMAGN